MVATTTRIEDPEAASGLRLLSPSGIDRLPWLSVPGCPGVAEKELWRSGDLVHALIRFAPGSRTPGRPHLVADHHIWVIEGTATIGGRQVVAGSYVHVPPTMEHPIESTDPEGCTILQLHHRYRSM
jgi:ChrR-like protein with cupin domain